tara:strand:+ start:505 stop:978 length:474 start_codon:yes stop_codon:yes gene_type:complete
MKRFLLLALTAGLSLPAFAEVDPNVHKMCLQAQDYAGCVRLQSGQSSQNRLTIDQGVSLSEGNECPAGHAYMGGGYCREVVCQWKGLKQATVLGGKKWRCQRSLAGGHNLQTGYQVRVGSNPNCPKGEPEIGWQSTCDSPYREPPKSDRVYGRSVGY